MKAAVLYEYNQPLVVEELEYENPGPGEVLVQVVASGVCHTDLSAIEDKLFNRVPVPAVLGHEGAGIVQEVGPGVTTVTPGDHVILSWVPQCGKCHYCTIGRPSLCVEWGSRRNVVHFRRQGRQIYQFSVASFAEYSVVSENACIKIRPDAPLEKVCLIGCGVMTGAGAAINAAKVRPGSTVLVIGCGGVGLNVIQGAALSGAGMIIAADILDNKLALARQFGATHVINSRTADVVAGVKDLTGGTGVDYSFEVIATVDTIRQAYDALAPGGVCVVVGSAPRGSEVAIPANSFFDEKTITGTRYGSARMRVDIPLLVDLYMEKKLKLDELISQVMPMEGINQAFEDLKAGKVARTVLKY